MVIWNLSISDVCGKPESDPYFCTRYVTLSLIATFTGLLCLGKVAKYHYNKVKCFYQLSIFYCALFECLCFVLHWIFLPFDIIENMGYWFRVIQLLIVCFVYSKLASNVLNAEEQYKKRYLPVLTVFALYYAALIPWMFTIPRFKYPHKCTEFFHPCYTISDFVLAQIFLICGVYLTRKMALVNMPSEQFLDQKNQLWGVIMAFETEAIISIVYDILLFAIGAEEHGCGGFLYQHNALSVVVFVIVRSVRLFAAIWLMLYLFDAQTTDYTEPPPYTYDPEDSLDEYMAARSQSIVPYNPEGLLYDTEEPLLQENTFENYLADDGNERFGERTNRQLIEAGTSNPYAE